MRARAQPQCLLCDKSHLQRSRRDPKGLKGANLDRFAPRLLQYYLVARPLMGKTLALNHDDGCSAQARLLLGGRWASRTLVVGIGCKRWKDRSLQLDNIAGSRGANGTIMQQCSSTIRTKRFSAMCACRAAQSVLSYSHAESYCPA